jgi:hypothetical protein
VLRSGHSGAGGCSGTKEEQYHATGHVQALALFIFKQTLKRQSNKTFVYFRPGRQAILNFFRMFVELFAFEIATTENQELNLGHPFLSLFTIFLRGGAAPAWLIILLHCFF